MPRAGSRATDEHADGFASLIVPDMEAYAERYGEKVARKYVAIPARLNASAEARDA